MTQKKSVNLSELANELKAFTNSRIAALKQATISGIAKSIPLLVERSPVDTGLYAQSWAMTVEEWGAILGNYAPYAGIIEYGAQPYKAPIGPLLEWAKRVTGDGSQPPNYSNQVWALARYTQNRIAIRGFYPKHIMEDAIPEIIENIRMEYAKIE